MKRLFDLAATLLGLLLIWPDEGNFKFWILDFELTPLSVIS